jgi:hypothetical protein
MRRTRSDHSPTGERRNGTNGDDPAWTGVRHRQWSVVSHSGEKKPVEHMVGAGITVDLLTDDGMGQTLDWLDAHDPAKRCTGRARHARQVVDVHIQQIHVETTSFSVRGEDAGNAGAEAPGTPQYGSQSAIREATMLTRRAGHTTPKGSRRSSNRWMGAVTLR